MGIKTSGTVKAGNIVLLAGGKIKIGAADISETELEMIDGITAGTAVASKALVLDASSDITSGINDFAVDGNRLATANVGAANTGVTAVEHGDALFHRTVLTVSQASALTLGDDESLADGYLLYTFPAGSIAVHSAMMSMTVTNTEHNTEATDDGLGTTIGTGSVAILGGTAAMENILTGQTEAVGTLGQTAVNTALMIASGGDHTVHFNSAAAWANTAGTALDADIAGTVILEWSFLA